MSGHHPGSSNALEFQIPAIVFCVLTPLSVILRFWSRLNGNNTLVVDDWTILGSLILSLGFSILMLAAVHYGFRQHITSFSHSDELMTLKLFYIAEVLYKVNINITKASILVFYLRIFVKKSFRVVCWIMIGIVIAYGIASAAAAVFQCTPIPRAWNKSIPGFCINITINLYADAGFSIFTDIIILLLPMPLIYSLKLQTTQRLALIFPFGLGSFVVIASIMRMTTLNLSSTSPDTAYEMKSSLWILIEANIGIICACLPMCRLPLSLLFPNIFPSYLENYNISSANFSQAGTSKNEWIPPSNKPRNIQLTSVNAGMDSNSEEYILQNNGEGSTSGDTMSIRKIVEFSVEYDIQKSERVGK